MGVQETATLTIIDDDVSTPDYAGNSLNTARDIGILNGSQNFKDYVDAIDNNDYYRFELLKNSTFNLALNGLSADANVQLLNSAGVVIASSTTSGTNPEAINQTLNVGVYYIRVYRQSAQTTYNLDLTGTPLVTPLQINAISPNTGSTAGQVTLTIKGDQFTNDAAVSIIAPDNTTRGATNVIWQNDKTLTATFDLTGLTAGAYDVRVSEQAGTAISNDSFNVGSGSPGQLEVFISAPGAIRPWQTGEVTVTYRNAGNTDIAAPLLTLLATGGLFQPVGQTGFTDSSVQFLGINSQGNAGTLAPGATGTYTLRFKPNSGSGNVNFTLSTLSSGQSIDWNSIKDNSRPSEISADAWNVIYSNFTTSVGTTTDSYQKVLGDNATTLSQQGIYTTDVSKLLAFELQQASATSPGATLASAIDAAAATPGLSLTFTFGRTFLQPLSGRFALGTLGRGWTNPWDISATTDASGNVTIQDYGSFRTFTKRTDGTYQSQTGDTAILSLVGGTYRLIEKGGTVIAFRTDGKLDSIQDSNNNRITATYTGNQLTQLTHSNSDYFNLSYNAQGRISQLTDQTGRVTTYSYDAAGEHLLSVSGPDGTTSYAYNTGAGTALENSLQSITFTDGTHSYFQYDAQGRLSRQSGDGGANAVTYTYDANGGVTVTDATGAATQLTINDLGQIGQSQDALGRVTQFRYDSNGNLSQIIAPGNTLASFTYDSQGNLLSSTDPLGQRVDFTYDPRFDQVQNVRDQRGNSTAYNYDQWGNLQNITYTDGSRESFSYDTQGNLTISANRRGQTLNYTYDNRGLLLRKAYPDGTSATYTYDNRGNLLTATDSDSTKTYTYDNADRLTSITEGNGRFLAFTYDAGGRRTQMTDQSGAVTNYAYDAAGRLSGLTDGNGQRIIAYTYDSVGRLSREDNGNGTTTTYSYDAAGQVLSIVNATATGTVNSRFDYTYDSLGRRTSMTTLDGRTDYGYDATGQLTSVNLPTGRTIQYRYDAAGNRTTVSDSGATTTYATNNLNQYTTVGGDTYTYDTDGNLTSKTEGGTTWTYAYDTENRLISVSKPGDTWTYSYDALGTRIASTHNGQRTEYLVDPTGLGDVVGEFDGTGNLSAHYTHGLGLVSRSDANNIDYYDADAIGSIVGLSGSSGSYLNHYSYLPFGESLTKVEAVANSFEYVGQFGVMNEDNNLNFMRARYYSASQGRFITVDPIGQIGGINTYSYASQNPVNAIDPTGLYAPSPLDKIIKYGNWGGPHLSGGQWIAEGELGNRNTPPIDWVDKWWKYHDINVYDRKEGATEKAKLGALTELLLRDYSPETFGGSTPDFTQHLAVLGFFFLGFPATDSSGKYSTNPFNIRKLVNLVKEDPEFRRTLLKDFNTSISSSRDPNDIVGPGGFGTPGWLASDQTLPYTIRFENQATATAPATFITVTHQLDTDLDLKTFELGDFGFGSIYVDVPDGLQSYRTRLDLRSTIGDYVDFNASLNPTTRTVTWTLTTIDPLTGDLPNNVNAGFLPPNNANHDGEGFVNYKIKANPSTTGTTIDAQAQIVFDTNAPIDTPVWLNTLDGTDPISSVTPLPSTTVNSSFAVDWSGTDSGSGIASYDIYVSVDGSAYSLWQNDTTATSALYTGQIGHTYAFYSDAKDNVGYIEANPATADATITVIAANNPPIVEANKTIALQEDTSTLLTIATPTDPDGNSLTITVNTLPDNTKGAIHLANGTPVTPNQTLTLAELTGLLFAPNPNANGSAGTFRYTVSDGQGGTASQTIALTINPVNDLPTATNDTAQTNQNSTVIINLLTNDSDIDGTLIPSTVTLANNPTHGTVTLNPTTGAATYTPTANYTGADSFTYTVKDNENGTSNPATVNITVNPTVNIIQGTSGNNTLIGTNLIDTIDGKAGNDTLTGGKGNDTLIGGGGRDRFIINLNDGTDTITDFGGVGIGSNPTSTIRAEVDTIQFQGTGLTARNFLLTQNGPNLEMTFESVSGTKVILQNFALQNLDNIPVAGSNPATGNIIFNGQTSITDSYDVFDANSTQTSLFSENTITFLNDLNNTVNDGKSGRDLLRGGAGNDTLLGGRGSDTLRGGLGNDSLTGGIGQDFFVLALGEGTDTVSDFNRTTDKIALADGLSFGQLTITQGTGSNANNTLIANSTNSELLAIVNGVQANTLNSTMFVAYP